MKKPLFTDDGRLVSQIDYAAVLESFDKVVTNYGRKAVAKGLGYSYEQLRRITEPEPNPDEVRHLRLDKAMEITEITRTTDPWKKISAEFGLFLFEKKPIPDKKTSREEGADDLREVSVMQAMMAEGRSASEVQTQAMRACDEIMETAIIYANEKDQMGNKPPVSSDSVRVQQ